jgi:hypothetical protein
MEVNDLLKSTPFILSKMLYRMITLIHIQPTHEPFC